MATDRVRVRVVVSGRVQGVWYRESCRREADTAGVAGWIRNTWDGKVEAALEGSQHAVDQVLAWMRIGPPRAHVTAVEVVSEEPIGDARFVVR
jgi:acylphosphatase